MSDGIDIKLTVSEHLFDKLRRGLSEKLRNPGDDAMYKIHQLLANTFRPYVPIDMEDYYGEESRPDHMVDMVEVTPEHIKYPGPYAHYMYEGEIYGPNIPLFDAEGNVIGWRSPKGKKKHPTGRYFDYTSPTATMHWDEAALTDHRDEIEKEIRRIIIEAWRDERR